MSNDSNGRSSDMQIGLATLQRLTACSGVIRQLIGSSPPRVCASASGMLSNPGRLQNSQLLLLYNAIILRYRAERTFCRVETELRLRSSCSNLDLGANMPLYLLLRRSFGWTHAWSEVVSCAALYYCISWRAENLSSLMQLGRKLRGPSPEKQKVMSHLPLHSNVAPLHKARAYHSTS